METEIKTEGEVIDTTNDTQEEREEDVVSVPRKEYETLNQTLGSLKKQLKEFRKAKETKETSEEEVPQKSSDLGEKAYLLANGIKTAEEREFFQRMKKETGKDTEALLESTYFQTELKDFREKRDSANATPSSTKRTSNSSVDSVEYWLAKDEMPPREYGEELRRAYVNAKMKKEDSKGVFYNS